MTVAADIKVDLKTSHILHKLKVHTIFSADFKGRYLFRNDNPELGRVRLFFPFPLGTTQARNASLKIDQGEGRFAEPPEVQYSLAGIGWSGPLEYGRTVKAEVTFGAQGSDRFVYQGPGAGRAESFNMTIVADRLPDDAVPADALQPTQMDKRSVTWKYDNLITNRGIIVDLPGATSPMGRVMFLFELAGLAVLLFGLGFKYMADLHQPGSLDDFRWGHFLLLALNYFIFFIIFMVLTLDRLLGPWPAIIVSAAISLPLLLLHVSRIMDRRFALNMVLPLAVFTLVMVIGGVYAGGLQKYVFLAGLVIAVGFLTFSYKAYGERRKAHQEQKARLREEALRGASDKKSQEKEQRRLENRRAQILAGPGGRLAAARELWERVERTAAQIEALAEKLPAGDPVLESIKKRLGERAELARDSKELGRPLRRRQLPLSQPERITVWRVYVLCDTDRGADSKRADECGHGQGTGAVVAAGRPCPVAAEHACDS